MPMDNASGPRKARPQRRGKRAPLYAAVDLGTNNCRLLIARRHGELFRVVESYSQVVRLGEGLTATGQLSDGAMARTFDAIVAIRGKLKKHGVGRFRCIATEACRKAENGAAFITRVREETGLSFKIIGPQEEARLAAIGCHDLIEPDVKLVMVLDIGGGSTEISFIDMSQLDDRNLPGLVKSVPIQAWASFPLGVVTLTEHFAHLGPEASYEAMFGYARDKFIGWKKGRQFVEPVNREDAYMVGTSGTVTCLAGIHLELERYRRDKVDGVWLTRTDAADVIQRLRAAGPEGRLAFPTVGADRAELMMAGCAILDAAWSVWQTQKLRVADRGLREGLLLSMMHGAPRRGRSGRRRGRGGRKGGGSPSQVQGSNA